jgi:serine/threonine protein phosphatase PrpC
MSGKRAESLYRWEIIGASVQGIYHRKNRKPNQDAILYTPKKASPQVFLAVADGHGSERSFRSQQGAKFAVRAAKSVCEDILKSYNAIRPISQKEEMVRLAHNLPHQIVNLWRKMVEGHLNQHPFRNKEKLSNGRHTLENTYLVYGTTLLIVLVSEYFIIYAQLGDGDILTVLDGGQICRPLPRDERLLANETTSLCMPDAENNFRLKIEIVESIPPSLILVSSDGYANSFLKETGFLQVGSDLLTLIRQEGIDNVRNALPDWLNETSTEGSGDDITAGILYRKENN